MFKTFEINHTHVAITVRLSEGVTLILFRVQMLFWVNRQMVRLQENDLRYKITCINCEAEINIISQVGASSLDPAGGEGNFHDLNRSRCPEELRIARALVDSANTESVSYNEDVRKCAHLAVCLKIQCEQTTPYGPAHVCMSVCRIFPTEINNLQDRQRRRCTTMETYCYC